MTKSGGFKLSQRSLDNLEGVDEKLCLIVVRAIQLTNIDFGCICGLRTKEEQAELFRNGASQCDGISKRSKHQDGLAVDLMAYIGNRASWEIRCYDNIADAVKQAAIEIDAGVRWGAAWHVPDIREWAGTMEEAMNSYTDLRRAQGKRPFIDGPHFERS